jgi:hypothetical protein
MCTVFLKVRFMEYAKSYNVLDLYWIPSASMNTTRNMSNPRLILYHILKLRKLNIFRFYVATQI